MSEIDWSKAQIYKVVNLLNPMEIYIGGTTQILSDRMKSHIYHALYGREGYWSPFYLHMFEVGVENFEIIPEEKVPYVKNMAELEKEEFRIIKKYQELNYTILNTITSEEMKSKHMAEKRKEEFENNPELRSEFTRFNYGCVHRSYYSNDDVNYYFWGFSWVDENKKRNKKIFPEHVYGDRAEEFARAYQKFIYNELKEDDDNTDEILDDLKYYEIQPGSIYKIKNYWVYQWYEKKGKVKRKLYPINKHGEEGAQKLALDYQTKRLVFTIFKKMINK